MSKLSLVTGGAGFIGSHLCDKLLALGHEVYCLDNFLTSSEKNIEHLKNHPRFHFINQDVTEPLELKRMDWIFNLASPASPVQYQSRPIQTTRTNILGALNVLDFAKSCKARVFQASTSEVYGSPSIHPQPESYWGNVNPIGPRSCYDEGKRCVETLFFDYWREHKLDIRVGRIFNTFGPRMQPDDGRVVSNFIVRALSDEKLTLNGSGTQTRSFCYVTDMVEAIIKFMSLEENFPGPLNLGNPEEIEIGELADLILKLTNSRSEISYQSLPEDDPVKRKPDISLVTVKTGWLPTTDLYKGLEETINYFQSLRV